jgi:hypothetical protein
MSVGPSGGMSVEPRGHICRSDRGCGERVPAEAGQRGRQAGVTAIGFWARARVWFTAHGITTITRVITDNGPAYRSAAFARAVAHAGRHQRTRPFTPKHNGKVERYQPILAEELLYARPFTSEAERAAAIQAWNIHYNYHRPHTAAGNQPPAHRLDTGVTNVTRSYN